MSTQSLWQSWVRSPSHGSRTFHTEPGCCLCSFHPEVSWGSRGQSPFCWEAVSAAISSQPLSERSSTPPATPHSSDGPLLVSQRGSLRVCAVGRTDPPVLVKTAGQGGQETTLPGHGLSTQCSVEPSRPQRLHCLFKQILNY